MNLRFAQPLWFLLLLLLPIMIAHLVISRRTLQPRLRFSAIRLLGRPSKSVRILMRPLPKLLTLLALSLMMIAMARPQSPWQEHQRRSEGISIMLAIDVSESMRALDFKPNRLEKSKEVVKDFVRGRTEDAIGLVIFGKESFALCPMTHDYAALETFLSRIDFDLLDGNATAIGMGLANAVNKIKDSPTKSKVIILLTDGENNAGEIQPLTAAELAQKLGIRVYTIGVGSQGIVTIPIQNQRGGWEVGSIRSNIDVETLGKIAEMTGGQFFAATDGESLAQIYGQIDKMERTKIEINESNYFDELAHWFMLPAMFLFVLGFALEQTWLRSFP